MPSFFDGRVAGWQHVGVLVNALEAPQGRSGRHLREQKGRIDGMLRSPPHVVARLVRECVDTAFVLSS
jgi:hypothetical protein